MPEAPAQPATFAFEAPAGKPWAGTPVINGHEILSAQSINVHLDPAAIPVVTVALIAADALKLVLGDARIVIADETREALISMGWTPPAGEAS